MKKFFIDGLSGMAQGLFATLIIGTIIQQIGTVCRRHIPETLIYVVGKMAAAMTGAGIGVGVARKFNADQLVVVSAATAGMVGAFAGKTAGRSAVLTGREHASDRTGRTAGSISRSLCCRLRLGGLVSGKTKD